MSSIASILKDKGQTVHSVAKESPVFEAIRSMADHNVGSMLVMEDKKILGIFTERDYLKKIALKFRSSRNTEVSEVMSAPVITASSTDSVEECLKVMTNNRCRHLPIVDGRKVIGMVSIGDLVNQLLTEKTEEVEQLSHYIQGEY